MTRLRLQLASDGASVSVETLSFPPPALATARTHPCSLSLCHSVTWQSTAHTPDTRITPPTISPSKKTHTLAPDRIVLAQKAHGILWRRTKLIKHLPVPAQPEHVWGRARESDSDSARAREREHINARTQTVTAPRSRTPLSNHTPRHIHEHPTARTSPPMPAAAVLPIRPRSSSKENAWFALGL